MFKNVNPERLWLYHMLLFVVVCLLLAGSVFAGIQWMYRDITVACDQEEGKNTFTTASTVGEYLTAAGIQLGPHDAVSPSETTPIKDGMTLTVTHAIDVKITADGNTKTVTTLPGTVRDALHQADISLGEMDEVIPAADSLLTADSSIRVVRITMKEWVEKALTNPQEIRKADSGLVIGSTRVLVRGRAGVTENTWQVVYQDGVETDRQLLVSRNISSPVSRVVAYGTKEQSNAALANVDFSTKEALSVTATAYVAGGTTKSGLPAKVGVIAVDPSVIPLGTRVYVEGYGYAIAADTGGKIKNNRIDICLPTQAECVKWGVKRVKLYVLD